MGNIFLNPQDVPSAKLAEFFCTIGDRRYSMLNAKNLEANASVSLADVKRLGTIVTGKKANGLEIKLSMTVYKCSEMFDDVITTFKDTGVMPTFEVQVTSEDKATAMGRSTKTYYDCVIDGDVLLSMVDADGEFIEQTIEAYAMDYSQDEKYKEPSYM
jgi:hypothetical protein